MTAASWPIGKLSLVLAAVAITRSFPVRKLRRATFDADPIGEAYEHFSAMKESTLGLASGARPSPTCWAGKATTGRKRANSISE
jgi:hypothetical protein